MLKTWWKNPLLLLLALIFWYVDTQRFCQKHLANKAVTPCRCVPIATNFPPATLSVGSAPGIPFSMRQVPQLDFTTLNYAAPLQYSISNGNLTDWAWKGPSQPVQHIALAVMELGQILPITPPAANASWTVDFWGPAL